MNVIKKFTAIEVETNNVNDNVDIVLTYGRITGPYYDREYPKEVFDTEEEAIEYAYKKSRLGRWLILPIITFV